jgi:hypothetical protein
VSHRIAKEDYSRLWSWIGSKETRGDDCFGQPPMMDKGVELERQVELEPGSRDERGESPDEGLQRLDEFVGLGSAKQLDSDRDSPLMGEPERQSERVDSLNEFLGPETTQGQQLEQQHDMSDLALMFEGGDDLDRDRDEDTERDDGSDLFDMGIN